MIDWKWFVSTRWHMKRLGRLSRRKAVKLATFSSAGRVVRREQLGEHSPVSMWVRR